MYENLKFPTNEKTHPTLRGKTFSEIYEAEPGFVEFSKGWVESTGIFKKWSEYIKIRE
jgi:hypothetical protein